MHILFNETINLEHLVLTCKQTIDMIEDNKKIIINLNMRKRYVMDNNLLVELMNRVIKLEQEVRELKKQNKPQESEKYMQLVNFLEKNDFDNQFNISFIDLKRELDLKDSLSFNEFLKSPYCKKLSRTKYFVHSASPDYINFAKRPDTKVGTFEITTHIQDIILKSTEEYVTILASDIHEQLNLFQRMPSVCKVMKKMKDLDNDSVILSDPEKLMTSKLTIKYKKSNFNN